MSKGQSQIHLLLSATALIGSVAAPLLYVGQMKTDIAVNASNIAADHATVLKLQDDLTATKEDAAASRAYLETILHRAGINPNNITQ